MLSASLLLFVGIAGWNVSVPGLYYDELLFVNGALGGQTDIFIFYRLGDLPVMLMPYIGALKAWLYYPIFSLFDVTAYTVRWPVIAIGAVTLWIGYQYVKTAFSRGAATIFVLLAAVEPSTLFHTRLDWGPTTLMMLLRSLLLLSLVAWLKTGKPWYVIAAGAFAVLGVFDKLNFIWIVLAAGLALVMVYPRQLLEFANRHRRGVVATACVLVALVAIGLWVVARSNTSWGSEIGSFDLASRLQHVKRMLQVTFGGVGVYLVVIGQNQMIQGGVVQLAALGFMTMVGILVWAAKRKIAGGGKEFAFIMLFALLVLAQLFMTTRATGPHHMAVLAPLWLIPLAALLAPAFEGGAGLRERVLQVMVFAAIAGVLVSSLAINRAYLMAFDGPVNPRWDPASSEAVTILALVERERPIFAVDWGMGTIIHGLLNGRANVNDHWPLFKDGLSDEHKEWYEKEFLPKTPLFVVPAIGKETFPETRRNFFDVAASRRWQVSQYAEIKRQDGSVLYEIYSVTNRPSTAK